MYTYYESCPFLHGVRTTLYLRMEECRETLREISELASEADDLRGQAVYDCCHFDVLLDVGRFLMTQSKKFECSRPRYWTR